MNSAEDNQAFVRELLRAKYPLYARRMEIAVRAAAYEETALDRLPAAV